MQHRVTLRAAETADMPFLFQVYASTRAEELAQVPWSGEEVRAFLVMQFNAQHTYYQSHYAGAQFLVILVDDVPAGRLYIDWWEMELRVMDIALLPEFRNQGIGSQLIGDLLRQAAARRLPVTLHVEPFNPAMRLYTRLGFQKIGEAGVYWLMRWESPAASAD
jgi:ribosomal protein S18 acetylase RimI-like enzyme